MNAPFQVASFEGYRLAIIEELAPRLPGDARGIDVRLNARRRHIDVVVFRGGSTMADALTLALLEIVSTLSARFDDFVEYTSGVILEPCGDVAPLIYRGVPVWERPRVRWQLAPAPREAGLLVQAG